MAVVNTKAIWLASEFLVLDYKELRAEEMMLLNWATAMCVYLWYVTLLETIKELS